MTHWFLMGYRALYFKATNTNLPWEDGDTKRLPWINFSLIPLPAYPSNASYSHILQASNLRAVTSHLYLKDTYIFNQVKKWMLLIYFSLKSVTK